MNLMIFAIAIAAILLFFTFNVVALFQARQAENQLQRFVTEIKAEVYNSNDCDFQVFSFPEKIKIFYGISPYNYGYLLRVSKVPGTQDNQYLVFSISKWNEPTKVVAASSIDLPATTLVEIKKQGFEYDQSGNPVATCAPDQEFSVNTAQELLRKVVIFKKRVVVPEDIDGDGVTPDATDYLLVYLCSECDTSLIAEGTLYDCECLKDPCQYPEQCA